MNVSLSIGTGSPVERHGFLSMRVMAIVFAWVAFASIGAAQPWVQFPARFGEALAKIQEQSAQSAARHQKDLENDISDGKKYALEADKEYKPTKNADYQARVDRIGGELAAIASTTAVSVSWGDPRLNPFPYSFRVVQGEDVNAFSLPGGVIYVFEGLLKYAETDDELAGVLAHEISHAAFRHLATLRKEQSRLEAITLPLILLSLLTGGAGAAPLIYGTSLVGQAIGSGWSVKAEQAADFGAFQFLSKSKYSALGMLTFMERLAYDERTKPQIDWGIFRSHPPGRDRANVLIIRLDESGIPIRRSLASTTMRSEVKPGDNGVEVWFNGVKIHSFAGSSALDRADDAAIKLNAFFDQVPKLFDAQVSDEHVVMGKRVALFTVMESDAASAKTTIPELAGIALKNVKRAAFELSYRVWSAY